MFVPRLKASGGKSKAGATRRLGKPPSSFHSSTELDKLKTSRFYPALRNRGRGIRKIGNSPKHGAVKYGPRREDARTPVRRRFWNHRKIVYSFKRRVSARDPTEYHKNRSFHD
jgi:hypothetical protein